MTNNLEKLELELEKIFKNGNFNAEAFFNYGVKFGRELQLSNLQDYRLAMFVKHEAQVILRDKIYDIIKQLNNILLDQVHSAVKETIKNNGSWCAGVGYYERDKGVFDQAIVDKYLVQFRSASQVNTDSHFETYFVFKGKLEEIFVQYKFANSFVITFDNDSGGDSATLYRIEDVIALYSPSLLINVENTTEDYNRLCSFRDAIIKKLLFSMVANNSV